MNGEAILERARAIVGPPPAPFRGEIENWEDRIGVACLALVLAARGSHRKPADAVKTELKRQREIASRECMMFTSITGDDLDDD